MTEQRYTGDCTAAREFRVVSAPLGDEFVLEWMSMSGTIMTVTTIKISRSGLAETLRVIDAIRDKLP